MHNIWLIAKREYLERIRARSFIVMTILAVTLGSMNVVGKRGDGRNDPFFLIQVLVPCGVAVVWSGLVLPICLWVCFGASAIGVRIGVLMGYVITLTAILVGVVVAASEGRVSPEGPLGYFLLLHAGLLATLFSGLGLARACGYVLVSVRTARQTLSAGTSPFGPAEEAPG